MQKSVLPMLYAVAVFAVIGMLLIDTNTQGFSQLAQAQATAINRNLGTINVRAIVANIDGANEQFTAEKFQELNQALSRLDTVVRQSSYGQARLRWSASDIVMVGSDICEHENYGDKVNDLIQQALEKADARKPIADYSMYLIVHSYPQCSGWSSSGRGEFKPYVLNGREVHLRGMQMLDLTESLMLHEFGHTLGYRPGVGIGHPDYLRCDITTGKTLVSVPISPNCEHWGDNTVWPIYNVMSSNGSLSDFSPPDKLTIGWLKPKDVPLAKPGSYVLSPLEQKGPNPKALKLQIPDTEYTAFISFREPAGYTYPDTPGKPNGLVIDITSAISQSFLITNDSNIDAPLLPGIAYRLGEAGPYVLLKGIKNNRAYVLVSKSLSTLKSIPKCTVTASTTSPITSYGRLLYVEPGSSVTLNWTSENATYALVQGEKGNTSGSLTYDNLTHPINFEITVYNSTGWGTCDASLLINIRG